MKKGRVDCDNKIDPPFFWPRYYLDAIQLVYHLHIPMMMQLERAWNFFLYPRGIDFYQNLL